MKKTYYSLTEQINLVKNFIKDNWRLFDDYNAEKTLVQLTLEKNKFLATLEMTYKDYYIFADNGSTTHRGIEVWMPDELANLKKNVESTVAKFCKENPKYNIARGDWYVITPVRWQAFIMWFNIITGKMPKSKKGSNNTKIDSTCQVKNNVAFVDMDNKAYEHLTDSTCSSNIDLCFDNSKDLGKVNQIDHFINAIKANKREADAMLVVLQKAKEAGAEYVIDSSYCPINEFYFK